MKNEIANVRLITNRLSKHAIANQVVDHINDLIKGGYNELGFTVISRVDDINTPFICSKEPFTDKEAVDNIQEAWVPISLKYGETVNEFWHMSVHCKWDPTLEVGDIGLIELAIKKAQKEILDTNIQDNQNSNTDPIVQFMIERDSTVQQLKYDKKASESLAGAWIFIFFMLIVFWAALS